MSTHALQNLAEPADLTSHFNNRGFTTTSSLGHGELNVWRNSIPATETLDSCSHCGTPFTVRSAGLELDNVVTLGQRIELSRTFTKGIRAIHFIGASERASSGNILLAQGARVLGSETLVLPDLWEGMPRGSTHLAYRSPQVHYPHHIQERLGLTLWHHTLSWRGDSIDAILLPRNPAMHVFGITIEATQ